jgi:hypothetical protein
MKTWGFSDSPATFFGLFLMKMKRKRERELTSHFGVCQLGYLNFGGRGIDNTKTESM